MKTVNDSMRRRHAFRPVLCVLLSWAGLAVISGWAADTATPASASSKVFNVREFGAKGDGKTLDTAAIQKALDECGNAGGGTVQFPSGTYLSQPITLRAKMIVQLDDGAVLKATDDRADFEIAGKPNTFVPFIGGKNLQDITITGQGVINGSGAKWWGPAEEARRKKPGYTLPRPNLIVLTGLGTCGWKTSPSKTLPNSIWFLRIAMA